MLIYLDAENAIMPASPHPSPLPIRRPGTLNQLSRLLTRPPARVHRLKPAVDESPCSSKQPPKLAAP